MTDPLRGCPWITFEGIEGSGKSTQLDRLARRLRATGHAVVETKEPGGTELGLRLRAILLDPESRELEPHAELLLYTADRLQHLEQVILPALRRYDIVLCDRYLDATLAYQGFGRGISLESILRLHAEAPLDRRPDRTLLFDLDPAEALSRARRRNEELEIADSEGRFEEEDLEFHGRVREGYLQLAAEAPERFRIIEAGGAPEEVEEQVVAAMRDAFPVLGGYAS